MSWGAPKWAAIAAPTPASSQRLRVVEDGGPPQVVGVRARPRPLVGGVGGVDADRLVRHVVAEHRSPVPVSTTMVSVSTLPETTASPSPHAAVITVSSVRPFAGLAVNITPAASAGTSRCTTTASDKPRRVDGMAGPVPDRPVRPQRGPAVAHRRHQRVRADDVEIGVLLAGEARLGQVLGRRGRADGHRHVVAQPGIGLADAVRDGGGHGSAARTALGDTGRRRLGRPGADHPGHHLCDGVVEAVGRDEVVIGGRGDDESVGHGEPCPGEFAEIGPLAPGDGHIGCRQAVEPADLIHRRFLSGLRLVGARAVPGSIPHHRPGARGSVRRWKAPGDNSFGFGPGLRPATAPPRRPAAPARAGRGR